MTTKLFTVFVKHNKYQVQEVVITQILANQNINTTHYDDHKIKIKSEILYMCVKGRELKQEEKKHKIIFQSS